MSKALPCIVCLKKLNNVFEDLDNQPSGGTTFTSHGHYGSTVFDPFDRTYLEINVCDECLTQAAAHAQVLLNTPTTRTDTHTVPWSPPSVDAGL